MTKVGLLPTSTGLTQVIHGSVRAGVLCWDMLHGSQLRRSTVCAQAHGGPCLLQLPGNDARPSVPEAETWGSPAAAGVAAEQQLLACTADGTVGLVSIFVIHVEVLQESILAK